MRLNTRYLSEALLCILVTGLVLFLYLTTHRPAADPISAYYVRNFMADTGATNAVAAIYLNYRMFDSMFETLMLLVSVAAVINFSWRRDHE